MHLFTFQFIKDGVFKAELNRFLTNELAEDGYSGVQVRHTPQKAEIIILATRTQSVLGKSIYIYFFNLILYFLHNVLLITFFFYKNIVIFYYSMFLFFVNAFNVYHI